MAGLPLFKLASLAIKQSAKPVANVIKRGAKGSDLFKKYLCFYPGQGNVTLSLVNACVNPTRVRISLWPLAFVTL